MREKRTLKQVLRSVQVKMADSWRDLATTMSTLYWSFYGLESQSNADVVLPNSVVKRRTNETVHVDPVGHRLTEVAGSFVYGIYFFCGPMILINLLIAIMSASFQSVTENSDIEWKFARVQVFLIDSMSKVLGCLLSCTVCEI